MHGDPGTPILRGYPGEELRLRLYQGSHEEQHSVTVAGMRWRVWPDDPTSPPRDQQTIGISEAFTLRIDDTHTPGDHLWSLPVTRDTWLGCWGLIRLHDELHADLPPLPVTATGPRLPGGRARRFHARVCAREIHYSDRRSDPFGLVYEVAGQEPDEPLILRCRTGEWVEVTLTNKLDEPPPATPFDPRLPADDDPALREISYHVSLHPGGVLRYDVRESDSSRVGRNPDSTVKPGGSVTYRWHADTPGVVLLYDRADIRTHRHRGLVGALVVEPPGVTPRDPATGRPRWVGELVLIVQDGLRLYHHGDPTQPVRDLEDSIEDRGQKAINLRSAHLLPVRPSLAVDPPTPVLECDPGDRFRLHLVVAGDFPRNHSVHVHGQTWPMQDHLTAPRVGAVGALSPGAARTLDGAASEPGDYAYRTGAFRWALPEGVWGLIRVRDG